MTGKETYLRRRARIGWRAATRSCGRIWRHRNLCGREYDSLTNDSARCYCPRAAGAGHECDSRVHPLQANDASAILPSMERCARAPVVVVAGPLPVVVVLGTPR